MTPTSVMKWIFSIIIFLLSIPLKDKVNAQSRKTFNMGCKCGRSVPDAPLPEQG